MVEFGISLKYNLTFPLKSTTGKTASFCLSPLVADKLAGTDFAVMGFDYDDNKALFFPKTSLQEDLRQISSKWYRLIATFSKGNNEPLFSQREYLARGLSFGHL